MGKAAAGAHRSAARARSRAQRKNDFRRARSQSRFERRAGSWLRCWNNIKAWLPGAVYRFAGGTRQRPAPPTRRNRKRFPGLSVAVQRADGTKCERCWNYSTHVGENADYPTVCERCVKALTEIEESGLAGRGKPGDGRIRVRGARWLWVSLGVLVADRATKFAYRTLHQLVFSPFRDFGHRGSGSQPESRHRVRHVFGFEFAVACAALDCKFRGGDGSCSCG